MEEKNGRLAFGRALIAETERRLFDESVPRLKRCLSLLEEEQVWRRPNSETVSVGNLVLHLCGNVRQWFRTGLLGEEDDRDRDREFSERGPIPKAELVRRVDAMEKETRELLARVDPAALLDVKEVQVFRESGISILVHVVEHFSYHVGQIGWFVKTMNEVDLKYYDDLDL